MDLNLLAQLLRELLASGYRVTLPGIGFLVSERSDCQISTDGLAIHPPLGSLEFKADENSDDDTLLRAYADDQKISLSIARGEIDEFFERFNKDLKSGKRLILLGIGTFNLLADGQIIFEKDNDFFPNPESFGLQSINIKPLLNKGRVEKIDGKKEIKNSYTRRKRSYTLKIVNVVIGILMLFAVYAFAIYIFRDDLRPLLEKVLYTKEERQLLKYINRR